ncbi:protein kinase [Actinoplanes sp. NPDC049599]|uniref:protein kinase domain-containing protein n=1 Tax=Actinoplanes sp. NPDC049599 TaxID=3363903 RepID=UPI0037B9B17B
MSQARDLIGGRYRLLEIIGAGGTGRVWLADDELLRRRVAVKQIGTPAGVTPAQLLDAQLTTMREARSAARFTHAGVAGIYDVVWRPDHSWIVMEHVESRSLDAAIRGDGPLPHREVARIGLGMLAALRAGHAAGVLHREVKPSHVLLATDGRVVLTDFGLARVGSAAPGPFTAPERRRGADADEAADLWSLGATLHAAVQGQPSFQRSAAPAHRPGPLTAIINRLLSDDPAQRPTAADTQAALQRVRDRAIGIFPMRIPRPRSRPTSTPSTPTGTPPTSTSPRAGVQEPTGGSIPTGTQAPAGGSIPTGTQAPAGGSIPAGTQVPTGATAPAGFAALGMSMILGRMAGARPARDRIARSTKVTLVAAAVLLVGTTGTALALDHRPGATPAPPVTTGVYAGPVAACATDGPAVTGTSEAHGYAVPTGWLWVADPAGFDVAVPRGWTRSQDGTASCFRDPAGSRSFRVDASARLTGPPAAFWRGREQDALALGRLPGYRREMLGALPAQDGAAWEFTWQPDGEPVRRHERRVLLGLAGGRAYLVEWATTEQDWTGTEPYLRLVLASLS